jgi:hypothetical protein
MDESKRWLKYPQVMPARAIKFSRCEFLGSLASLACQSLCMIHTTGQSRASWKKLYQAMCQMQK